jgi:hypothetical protein
MNESIHVKRDLILAAERAGGPPSATRGIEGNDKDLRDLAAYARSINMGPRMKKLPTDKDMATAIGQPNYYYIYQWASSYVHTTQMALDARFSTADDGTIQVHFTTTDLRTWLGVGVFAGELFSYGHAAACYFLEFETAESVDTFRRLVHDRLREVVRRSEVPGGERLFAGYCRALMLTLLLCAETAADLGERCSAVPDISQRFRTLCSHDVPTAARSETNRSSRSRSRTPAFSNVPRGLPYTPSNSATEDSRPRSPGGDERDTGLHVWPD